MVSLFINYLNLTTMKRMKLTIISVFAAVLIVASWGVTNTMKADLISHHVSGEMYQSDGESCSNPSIIVTGTSVNLKVDSRGEFDGYVQHGRSLTFSADNCISLTTDPITSDNLNMEIELQSSNSSSQNVKFVVSLKVAE